MNVKIETANTADMDPIVFANTWHAVEKLAGQHGWTLRHEAGNAQPFELTSPLGTYVPFNTITDALAWMEK